MNLNNHRVLFHWCLPPISWWAGSVGDFTLRPPEDPVIAIMSVEDSGGVLVRESSSALALAETHWTPWEMPRAPHTFHQSSSLLFLSGIFNIICPHCVLVELAVCKWYKNNLATYQQYRLYPSQTLHTDERLRQKISAHDFSFLSASMKIIIKLEKKIK